MRRGIGAYPQYPSMARSVGFEEGQTRMGKPTGEDEHDVEAYPRAFLPRHQCPAAARRYRDLAAGAVKGTLAWIASSFVMRHAVHGAWLFSGLHDLSESREEDWRAGEPEGYAFFPAAAPTQAKAMRQAAAIVGDENMTDADAPRAARAFDARMRRSR